MANRNGTVGRTLVYVNDDVPADTTDLMRAACDSRGVSLLDVHAPSFDFRPEWQLRGGELLFRPAISGAAVRVEQFLYARGVATLYEPSEAIFQYGASPVVFQRAGLPIPRTIYCANADRRLLRSHVEHLGGLPVVVKMPGYSRGVGVVRVDSLPALFSLMDYLTATRVCPSLCAYISGATHWRLTVVGDRVVSAYVNRVEADDFRTYASVEPEDYVQTPTPEMLELAVRAVGLMNVEFGGVDILAHPAGRLYLLEANFPAYFANAQRVAGVDIAGAIVEHLLAKADRLGGPSG